jgi:hypothetical protein
MQTCSHLALDRTLCRLPQSEKGGVMSIHPDLYNCNHHHPIKDDEEFVDFGTGRFVADKPMIPLLKALNELGLRTRTHNYGDTTHAFFSIILDDDTEVEIKTVNERDANRDTFNGERELLIVFKPKEPSHEP